MRGKRLRTPVRRHSTLTRSALWLLTSVALAAGIAALLAAGASAVPPTTSPVNVFVVQSDGVTGLAGVTIKYSCDSGPLLLFGTTDVNGHAGPVNLTDGKTCDYYAGYRGTSDESLGHLIANGNNNVNFQTSAVTVTLSDHSGGPLAGGVAAYGAAGSGGGTYFLNDTAAASTTDATGSVVGQLFDGTYDFRMQYNQGTQVKAQAVSGAATVAFQTGLLSIVYSNALSFGGGVGDAAWFTKSGTELLPGTFSFHPRGIGYPANSGCKPISIDAPAAGDMATKTIFAAQLADSTGAPIVGGVARYTTGGSWLSLGTTDAAGSACEVVDGALGNVKVGMTYNQAEEQKTQDVATNSVFSFQTALGTIRLVDHAAAGLSGGVVDQGGGFWNTGIATTNASGNAFVQLFPGHTYKFRMNYNHLSQQKLGDPTATPMVFQTGELLLRYSGAVSGSLGGSWVTFTKPSMELFAGTYNFVFDGYYLPMTVTEGASSEQSIVVAKLTNHLGQAIPGAAAQYAPGGSWLGMPNTNAGGLTGVAVPGTLGDVKVRMTYHQGTKVITQSQPSASFYAFQTALGTIRLVDHNGSGLAGGVVDQGGTFWDTGIATTNATGYAYVELFAGGSYKFKMNYNFTSQEQAAVDPTATPLVFQTGAVLSDSGTATQWAGGSWHPFAQNMEVLPGNYHFQFSDGTPVTYYDILAGTVNHIH